MINKIIPTILLLFFLLNIQAQNIISSSVYDAVNKEPLEFVNIGIKNKNLGTISKSNGDFEISEDYEAFLVKRK